MTEILRGIGVPVLNEGDMPPILVQSFILCFPYFNASTTNQHFIRNLAQMEATISCRNEIKGKSSDFNLDSPYLIPKKIYPPMITLGQE